MDRSGLALQRFSSYPMAVMPKREGALNSYQAPPYPAQRIKFMGRTHPHADATYRVISLPDDSFGVEVTIPDTYPTKVSGFPTKAAARAWIAKHKRQVAESDLFRPFGKRAAPFKRPG